MAATPWSALLLILTGVVAICLPFVPALILPGQKLVASHPALKAIAPPVLELPAPTVPVTGSWLSIPAINVSEPIVEGRDLSVLNAREGVWHQTGTLQDNYVLAGHRFQYLPPNTHTFYNLGKLKAGDDIAITVEGIRHEYTVKEVSQIPADRVDILKVTPAAQVTLYTCDDWAMSKRRLVVAVPAGSRLEKD